MMNKWGDFPQIQLEEDSRLPKYRQLVAALERIITGGGVKPDTRLPSENELFETLRLSRSTIRKALEELAGKRLIYSRQGQGSFVRGPHDAPVFPRSPDLAPLPADRSRGRSGGRGLIGLLLPSMSNEIYPLMVRGVEDAANSRGWTVFIGNTYADRDRELTLLEQMMDRGVDGLVVEPAHARFDTPDTRTFQLLAAYSRPCVLIDNEIPGLEFSRVMLDDVAGGRIATEHLIGLGHRRIAYVYKDSVLAALARRQGYEEALRDAGIGVDPSLILPYTEEDESLLPGFLRTREILSRADRPSAIFYYNDEVAFQGMRAIRELGLKVPRDVSLVGFDNVRAASEAGLSSIEHPKYLVGRWAADIVFDQIQAGASRIRRRVVVQAELVARGSSGAVPGTVSAL